MSFAIASAVISGIGAIANISAGRKAAKAAERQGDAQAATERKVTAERIRQIDREQMLMKEETKIRTAGSRISVGSKSTLEVLADQRSEFFREKLITQQVGASAATAALDRAGALSTQAKYQGYSSALGGISSIFSILGDKYG